MRLLDGPAEGSYMTRRSPMFLRAIVNAEGKGDVLNELTDTPANTEKVSVYRLASEPGVVHLHMRGKGTGFYLTGDYRHLPDIDGEQLRDTDKWREWCKSQLGKEEP